MTNPPPGAPYPGAQYPGSQHSGAQYPGVPPQPAVPPVPARSSKGCLIGVLVGLAILVVLAGAATVAVVWFVRSDAGPVGQCLPVDTQGDIDTSRGTVSCSDPNALWRITKVVDGHYDNVTGPCGPDADGLTYIAAENKSYCLEYYNY
jgi:hypothetical protein